MKQVVVGKDGVIVVEIPAPLLEPGCVLVAVAYSLISTGTEMSSVQGSSGGLVQKAIRQPEKVQKVMNWVQTRGVRATLEAVQGKLSAVSALGYSCAGIVIEVAADVNEFRPGDRVACAGAGKANHAEWVMVPKNLVVHVPDGVSLRDAASATLGSIALQGVRRADLRLGEWAAVVGLGLLGQITAQLLVAAGVRVIGFDLDPARVEKAKANGLEFAFLSNETDPAAEVLRLTQKQGVDATLLTAASKSDALIQQAIQMTRKKGKVVIVGAVGLGMKRSPLYEKEIDVLISCSYGPGRYDPLYEENGLDYPYAYVRWTENRNLEEYVRLLKTRQVHFETLVDAEYPLMQAPEAYAALRAEHPPVAVMLRYAVADNGPEKICGRWLSFGRPRPENRGDIRVAVVGAGSFAQGMHLPNLKKLPALYHLRAVVNRSGVNARNVGLQFGADYAATDFQQVINDPDVDAVFICTRHHLHAEQAVQAIEAGKAVFVEKPMALSDEEIDRIGAALKEHPVPFMVGFNRRFSPAIRRAQEILVNNPNPLMMLYRVNAGYIPLTHWVHGAEGGGRFVGEACHMVDVFQSLVTPARALSWQMCALQPQQSHLSSDDNVSLQIAYSDGSVATLVYTALGAPDLAKEYLEVFAGDRVLVVDDYKSLRVVGSNVKGWQSEVQDKGHLEELKQFGAYVLGKAEAPIAFADLAETTRVTTQSPIQR